MVETLCFGEEKCDKYWLDIDFFFFFKAVMLPYLLLLLLMHSLLLYMALLC